MISRRDFLKLTGAGMLSLYTATRGKFTLRAQAAIPGGTLDPVGLPRFVTPLLIPPVMPKAGTMNQPGGKPADYYEISMRQITQQILPAGLPPTTVWGYGAVTSASKKGLLIHNAPSLTIEAQAGRPVRIKWINDLKDANGNYLPHLLPVDPTLHWANTEVKGSLDDKDRVMRKSDGTFTYFVPDVAYHLAKFERGFAKVINVQGSDHHGTVARVRAGVQAAAKSLGLSIPRGYPDYLIHKMVRVMRGGEEVKMSKRAGSFVTLRDLIDWVGRDATRFFFLMRRSDAQLVFDIDLAKQQGNENPVYYVQYAHARVCSINRNAAEQGVALPHPDADCGGLALDEELALAKLLVRYPEGVVRNCHPTPILALTAHALQEYRDLCVSAGCSGYLSKPVRMRALLEAVEAALGDAGDTAARAMTIDAA